MVRRFPAPSVVAAVVALLAAAAPRPAGAGERVAVFAFEGFGLPRAIEMAPYGLSTHVSRRLGEAGKEIVEPALGLLDMLGAMGCEKLDEPCAAKIAAHAKVSKIVTGTLFGEDAPGRPARPKKGSDPLVWVRVEVFLADGSPHREINETVPGTVSRVTAEFERLAQLVVVLVDAAPAGAPAAAGPPGDAAGARARAGTPLRATTLLSIGALGAGAAGAVVAAVMGARWLGARADFRAGVDPYRGADGVPAIETTPYFAGERDLCDDGPAGLEAGAAADLEASGVFDACRRLRASALAGWIAGAAAGVLVAGGMALLAAGGSAEPASGGPTVRLVPEVTPGGAGATLAVSF